MLVIKSFVATAIAALTTVAVAASTTTADLKVVQNGTTKASHGHGKITPKVMIVSMVRCPGQVGWPELKQSVFFFLC